MYFMYTHLYRIDEAVLTRKIKYIYCYIEDWKGIK